MEKPRQESAKSRISINRSSGSGMDIRRDPRKKRSKYVYVAATVIPLALITIALSRLEPASPTVDRNVVILGTVERGDLVREVRGSGTLVPEMVHFVAAVTAGRVETTYYEGGEVVSADDIILELSNPDVELQVLQAEQQWTGAKAALLSMRQDLGSRTLQQEASLAVAHASYLDAKRNAEAFAELVQDNLVSKNEYQKARDDVEARETLLRTEESRLELLRTTTKAQVAVQQDQVGRLEAIFKYQERRAASMKVRAGADGVLQDFDLANGQWVQAGTTLARVARPDRLKAELRIPQTQARDVQIGQSALIDTRTDTIPGHVKRIDPNVQNGSVLVEVALDAELPRGARPDLSVDGVVQLERLADVLFVARPAYGQSNSSVSLFKLIDDGAAERMTVRLGRSSVNEIEILAGLAEGDRVIVSDMSRYDDVDRVRIR